MINNRLDELKLDTLCLHLQIEIFWKMLHSAKYRANSLESVKQQEEQKEVWKEVKDSRNNDRVHKEDFSREGHKGFLRWIVSRSKVNPFSYALIASWHGHGWLD